MITVEPLCLLTHGGSSVLGEGLPPIAGVHGSDSGSYRGNLPRQELIDSRQWGRELAGRVEQQAATAREWTAGNECDRLQSEQEALRSVLQQWEEAALLARDTLQDTLERATSSERELLGFVEQLEKQLVNLQGQLQEWRCRLAAAEGDGGSEEEVEAAAHGWRVSKDTLQGLQAMEPVTDGLKSQLNELCRFTRDVGAQSERVSALMKEYSSLSLQASRQCQNKEKLLEQRFRTSYRDFQQWLLNARITTAKCFDIPQSISDTSSSLHKLQEFLGNKEQGHTRLAAVETHGELLSGTVGKERADAIWIKVSGAREDWKSLMSSLHKRELSLQSLRSQMEELEASAEPLQAWLSDTECAVRDSGRRLHNLEAKREEMQRLQEKASRVDRIVAEHQLFAQGLKELQGWVTDAQRTLETSSAPTADKNMLDDRMVQLEALLTARQEKEIQLKMLITRGESVQRNTSPEGVPVIRKQIQDLKDSWDSLLSACIQCKSQLGVVLSQWTSYQDDVRQFVAWMENVEDALGAADRPHAEMRDKTASLGKAKLLYEEVLTHQGPLDTIGAKGMAMEEPCDSQVEIRELQTRYLSLSNRAQATVSRAEQLVLAHQEYQRRLHMMEDWLEQEQVRLEASLRIEGHIEDLDAALRELQVLQARCTEGEKLLDSVLESRERVVARGAPQIEDRALETARQDWGRYKERLFQNESQLAGNLERLREMEERFLSLEQWLKGMEVKGQQHGHRLSCRAAKEEELQLVQEYQKELLQRQHELDGLSALVQQVLEKKHLSSKAGARVPELTARYHSLLLQLTENQKQLQEELHSINEALSSFSSFSVWLGTLQQSFSGVVASPDTLERTTLENKMSRLESLQRDVEQGHGFLKAMRQKVVRAAAFLEQGEAEELRGELAARLSQLGDLAGSLRNKHNALEKRLLLAKEFLDKHKALVRWTEETRATLDTPVEPKAELYQKKAQLAKYKTIQQDVETHELAVGCVMEKGELLLDSVWDVSLRDEMVKLRTDFQQLQAMAASRVAGLAEQVQEHEAYSRSLLEVEKWLLQMSSSLVTRDSAQSDGLQGATQQLSRHKALMEEIAGFEERLTQLKEKGEELVEACPMHLQDRLHQQVQSHQQGARDSYSAICSTAQRVYQTLDRELQKLLTHQDALQQCQAWLSCVQQELHAHPQPPLSLQEALHQVTQERALQEQASTYLDLVCSVCDLSDGSVRGTAAEIQQVKLMVEERMSDSQDLVETWKEIQEQVLELEAHRRDVEQELQGLCRRPSELELKMAQNALVQVEDLQLRLQGDLSTLSHLMKDISSLSDGHMSPLHNELESLHHTWKELCHQVDGLHSRREEDLQRAESYHHHVAAVEEMFKHVSKEWDNLARTDMDNCAEHLEALRELASTLDHHRVAVEQLKEQKEKVFQHLGLDDKELVKEQIGHFEQRWAQLEVLVKKRIQDLVLSLDEMSQVESRLREAREWVEEQQPPFSQAMKMSPPPELAQNFLFDHLGICSELEVKQLLLAQARSDTERLMFNLGLCERQRLHSLLSHTQTELESFNIKVAQQRKQMSKAFTERTQLMTAIGQALVWLQQNERKALSKDYIALLPDDLAKQVTGCRSIQSSLRSYQGELTSLWSQGCDLMRDAGEDEKLEMRNKLQDLQNVFETTLQRCSQRLHELEKVLVSRKYFKVDLDKICQWLEHTDMVTFPEVNLQNGDAELHIQLSKYHNILEEATEYENLLLIVQRTGQEILPTLREVDHCYLDEKLNALPQQYNHILVLAKEKQERIKQELLARQEYASFIEVTNKALREVEEQVRYLEKQPVGMDVEKVSELRDEYKSLLCEVVDLTVAVSELTQRKESFRSTGQPWRTEEVIQVISCHHGLKRLLEQHIAQLGDSLQYLQDHQAFAKRLNSELVTGKGHLAQVGMETLTPEENLKHYHSLAGGLQGCLERLKKHKEITVPNVEDQLKVWHEELLSQQALVGQLMAESEDRFVQNADFETQAKRNLVWLKQILEAVRAPVNLEINMEKVEEDIRKKQILQEELQSRMRIISALSNTETQKYTGMSETVPAIMISSLKEIEELHVEVQQELNAQQVALNLALTICQKLHSTMQTENRWFQEAGEFLQGANSGVDLEQVEEQLQQLAELESTHRNFSACLEELETLSNKPEVFNSPLSTEDLRSNLEHVQHRGAEVWEKLQSHHNILTSCLDNWTSYQQARQAVVEMLDEVEQKLIMVSTGRAATCQEAVDKLERQKVLASMLNRLQEQLTGLEESAVKVSQDASDASRASVSQSVSAARQRWSRLNAAAQKQEKVLELAADEWRTFREKIEKVCVVVKDLQSRVPDGSPEKASKDGLVALLEYHDSFCREVERQHSTLTLLQQHSLALSGDAPTTVLAQEDIQTTQELCDSLLQQVRQSRADVQQELTEREQLEQELNLVRSWIQDVQNMLLSPTSDEEGLLRELEGQHGEVISRRQKAEEITEKQQIKYADFTSVPSEVSMQLAEVTLALGSTEDQIQAKEREIQHAKDLREDFSSRIQDISEKLKIISTRLKEKAADLTQAREETKGLCEDLQTCGRSLSEMETAVQELGEQNSHLCKQLSDAVSKLGEIYLHTAQLADCRTAQLRKMSSYFTQYNDMRDLIQSWTDRAHSLLNVSVVWSSSAQLQEQICGHQLLLQDSQDLQAAMQDMEEKAMLLSEVLQMEPLSRQVCELSRLAEELQLDLRTRLQSLQDAAKDVEELELEVRELHVAMEEAQATLTSPEMTQMSLKEQLVQRQHLLTEMEELKKQVQVVQATLGALRVPEDAVACLPVCRSALTLQQEASQLQHTAIQQCNILQEAVVQYEQYEQEVKHLQRLIEEAHRVIQDRPVSTSDIQELQAQIVHHEELAQKIKGYQEQIAGLNSKCKMLTVKAKHATMLLTVTEVEGLSETLDELEDEMLPKHTPPHPSVVMQGPLTQTPLSRSPMEEVYTLARPNSAASANLDELQRSWETLKNVISEKQKSLYQALERQQFYQDSLQSISTKMESAEAQLNEGLEQDQNPERQMAAHQALMDEIVMLQDEINGLQTCFAEESDEVEAEAADQLAMQSTLTVLAERMATIRMKASGRRQLLEERLSEQLEEQRREQVLQRYHSEADELDHWLLSTRAALSAALQPRTQDMDMEEQLIDCQNMLLEMEDKVASLSELSVHSESLLLEGRAHTRHEAEQLVLKLQTLKDSLLELQRLLQDKQGDIRGSLQEQEISEPDSVLSQSPGVQDWLAQARTARCQQHQDILQRQRELEENLAEQKQLLKSVASLGEELLIEKETGCSSGAELELEPEVWEQRLQKWESLIVELDTKLQLLQHTTEQERRTPVCCRTSRIHSPEPVDRTETHVKDYESLIALFVGVRRTLQDDHSRDSVEQQMYAATCSAVSWLDSVENRLFSGSMLLVEDAGTRLSAQAALQKNLQDVAEEVEHSRAILADAADSCGDVHDLAEKALECLQARVGLLNSVLGQRCEENRARLQEINTFQGELRMFSTLLNDSKRQTLQRLAEAVDRPASKQSEVVYEAEESLKEFEQRIAELKVRGETLQPDQVLTQELLKLQDTYEELVIAVGSRRSSLNQSLALKAQYEQALQDLSDLVDTARDKMAADQRMMAGSVEEVQSLLDKHKEFFQGLESHVVLTQTLFRKVSSLAPQREAQTLEEALGQAQAVLKQAHRRGVELESVLESWSLLEEKHQALLRQLEMVEASIPGVGLVEETEERLAERITLYQHLKSSLADRQPQLYQALEDGKRLLLSVSCSDLETQLTQLGDHWLSCTTRVNKELHRLDSTLKLWTRYQSESAELSQWLLDAQNRLEFWTSQSVTIPQELDSVRDHLYAFLDFSKEVDAKSPLKASVQSTGSQLLRLKKADTASLRSSLGQLDVQWAELLARIPLVQEKLHQLQMEKLASRHAISEMMSWISIMEKVIEEDQEKVKDAVGSEVIHGFLQKYKGFKIDMFCKQLTVDFVNQSVLQISGQDVETKRSDKTDFAEKLGAMNRRWQILQGIILEKVQLLAGLLESWMDFETSLQSLKTCFAVQEDKLKKMQKILDLASVQNALKDCQELEEMIKDKEKDVAKVEERGCSLIQNKTKETSAMITEALQDIRNIWASLDQLAGQQKINLKSVLDQWELYKRVLEEINGYLMEGRYSVSRFRLLTGALDAVRVQVENLQNLQDELEKQESSLRKFGSVTQQLLQECQASAAETLNGALQDINLRWEGLLEEISEQLRSSRALQQLWQRYEELFNQSTSGVQLQEEQADVLLKAACMGSDATDEEVSCWVQQCEELLQAEQSVQDSILVLQELGEQLRSQVDPAATAAMRMEQQSLLQRLSSVNQALCRQRDVLQAGVGEYESFCKQLDMLESWSQEAEERLKEPHPLSYADMSRVQDHVEQLKDQMLKFSGMMLELERLQELGHRLPLSDGELKRLHALNRKFMGTSAQTAEHFSKLQALVLQQQTFLQKCESWMEFLLRTEDRLAVDISGNHCSLLEQQKAHELFHAEMFSRQQVLHSIISEGQKLLDQGQVTDREQFKLKLALLNSQWQGVVRRAQQRRGIIDALSRQWQRYRHTSDKLSKWLAVVVETPQQGPPVSLQQARAQLDEVQMKEKALHRQQGTYVLIVEVARQLLLSADAGAECVLQEELTLMQDRWRHTHIRLDQQKRELLALLRDWDRCERGIGASLERLRAFRRKLSLPLPEQQEELHSEQIRCKELETTLGSWTEELAHLGLLKGALSSCICEDNLSVLDERMQLLQRQWEEICHQLSLRRQQVNEKLNEWAVFNEKNKELCEWLTQMESKVSQNGDISIEEMIEKLRKDYQEEIAMAQENKLQLQRMGERLSNASNEGKAAEIGYKLNKVNERWQHLLDLIGARVKKLKETLVAVQQLDKNMSNLRSWLGQIETELSRPIVYDSCDSQEIQRQLNQQQELQRDIEKHSTGVASVMNLCEVLLHDCDACASEAECESIQQATRGLDRRWRNICAASMERRLKIEETWRLWQKFLEDFTCFQDWLQDSETLAAQPKSSGVLYTAAKEELKKFEAFQRQVNESLTQLELINKQYRRLARENRTDAGCRLRQMVHEGNQRWDDLQRRAAAVVRRLKHFIGQREEFETTRDSVLVWLTEMDLQLTNIEHFSECDVNAKLKQLKAFQQEISLNSSKIAHVFVQGDRLLGTSEPLDAIVIEEELEELRRYCQEVFGRVERYYRKLTRSPLLDDEQDASDLDQDEFWNQRSGESPLSQGVPVTPVQLERTGRDTPASVDSIPLEWDHDYDLSQGPASEPGETAHEDLLDVVIPESPEAYVRVTEDTLRSSAGEPSTLDISRYHLQQAEDIVRSHTPTQSELDATYRGYMRLLGDCRSSIEAVKRVDGELRDDGDELPGFVSLNDSETQASGPGVIERWELIQAQEQNHQLLSERDLQHLQLLRADLDVLLHWLRETGEELQQLRRLDHSMEINDIKQSIKKLKEVQKDVDIHKPAVLSINLRSADLLCSESDVCLELQSKVKDMNGRWELLGRSLHDWRRSLQDALMQCQDFHEMSHGLLLWLENIDRRRNELLPVDSSLGREELLERERGLQQIHAELLESQQKVSLLQDMSAQLLVDTQGSHCLEAQEKVHVIGNRLLLLLRETSRDLERLEEMLRLSGSALGAAAQSGFTDASAGRSGQTQQELPRVKCSVQPGAAVSSAHRRSQRGSGCVSSHCEDRRRWPFILRVLRAALPLQLLLFLLLALACLVPATQEDYSCALANNFARSFHPMLRYTNGPPPI